MAATKYKPTTSGRRNMVVPSFDEITKFTPEKSLLTVKKNMPAETTTVANRRHRGGGTRKNIIIDFKRYHDQKATVIGIEYDPNTPPTSRFCNMKAARKDI